MGGNSPLTAIRFGRPFRALAFNVGQRSEYLIENLGKSRAHIFREESQHEIAVFLKQGIFASIAPVSGSAGQVLAAVKFDYETRFRAKQVHFHVPPAIERNR